MELVGERMRFRIGDYVRITSDYPVDRTLQGQRGDIVCSPEE